MKSGRTQGAIRLPLLIALIVAGALILSLVFYSFFNKLNLQVERILKEQFNQQQLMIARKIADNVEAYFDYLENELLAFPWRFRHITPSPAFEDYMAQRFLDMQRLGILEIRRYDVGGRLFQAWNEQDEPAPRQEITLREAYLSWVQNPQNRGRLFLGESQAWPEAPWEGRLVMPLLTPLYDNEEAVRPSGALMLLIDPFFISGEVIRDVRSGETGYAWIMNQKGIFLAHHEKDFVGHDAIQIRIARNPDLTYEGIKELHERIFRGEEGTGSYTSGWHREVIGEMEKLVGFSPIRFDKGIIRGVTDVENSERNIWGVAVVAPVEEVSGQVWEVLHQELILAGLFFLVLITASGVLIGVALIFNKKLAREVEAKTRELRESNELLLRSERFAAVGEAAAYVSHEIKNPLMVIGGLAQQAGRRLEHEPEVREKLRIIQDEVRRLENFLGDLRDFTRPAQPAKASIDLNEIIHEVHTLMDAEARKRHITLTERLDPDLPRPEADPSQMKQVLVNLIKNSLEAMDSGGEITLESGADRRHIWFSVQDTGAGIPPELLEKVFNPFFSTKEKGTGLGLAVIHKIITDHQGSVAVESEPGKGTTVWVKLPRQD
jgi:two-component system, NtrC family, sensor histidine kinase HydH